MLTPGLVKNRQFVGASISLLLFGIGMMGTLFLTVLVFVNLWDYSELEAALAITPVAVTAMLIAPVVGRFSDRLPPRVVRRAGAGRDGNRGLLDVDVAGRSRTSWPRFGAWRSWDSASAPRSRRCSIGSMGAIRGQELGLGSGIVNTARQVGFAIGIALFVAVFTGAVDNHVQEAAQRARAAEPNAPLVKREVGGERITVVSGEKADHILHEELRDAYGAAFRVGAFVVLLAIPFSWTMRRKPSDVQRDEASATVAAAAAA